MTLNKSDEILITVGSDLAIKIWDLTRRCLLNSIENAHFGNIYLYGLVIANINGVLISQDEKTFLTCSNDSSVKVWNYKNIYREPSSPTSPGVVASLLR